MKMIKMNVYVGLDDLNIHHQNRLILLATVVQAHMY